MVDCWQGIASWHKNIKVFEIWKGNLSKGKIDAFRNLALFYTQTLNKLFGLYQTRLTKLTEINQKRSQQHSVHTFEDWNLNHHKNAVKIKTFVWLVLKIGFTRVFNLTLLFPFISSIIKSVYISLIDVIVFYIGYLMWLLQAVFGRAQDWVFVTSAWATEIIVS